MDEEVLQLPERPETVKSDDTSNDAADLSQENLLPQIETPPLPPLPALRTKVQQQQMEDKPREHQAKNSVDVAKSRDSPRFQDEPEMRFDRTPVGCSENSSLAKV